MSAAIFLLLAIAISSLAQTPVSVGAGSYASYVPLSKSHTSAHGGCQAYQMEHRRLYLPDSLLARLGTPDGSQQGSLSLPTNDWWTHALVNQWTGKIWFYPGWAEAKDGELTIGYPTYWEPTGCEMKWDTPLSVNFKNTMNGKIANFQEALVDSWSDFMMSFIMQDGEQYTIAKSITGAEGGVQTIDIRKGGEAVEAQFVRIYCKKRNTGYGSSLWELEVYGEALCDKEETAIEWTDGHKDGSNYKFIRDGQLFIRLTDGTIYNAFGTLQ